MGYIVRLPGLGMQQDRATLVAWHVDPGEPVTAGELIAEIETEKSVIEIEAKEKGVLRRRYAEVGDERTPNEPLGLVAKADSDISSLKTEIDDSVVDADTTSRRESGPDDSGVANADTETEKSETRKISPRARRRAEELGIDPTAVDASGSAVSVEDIEATAETPDAPSSGSAADGEQEVRPTRTLREKRPLSEMRRTIAERLGTSYREAVHVTVEQTVEAEQLIAAADTAESALNVDVDVMDVLLVALSATLAEHPEFNATLTDQSLSMYEEHNIGIAVDGDRGLVVPVLADISAQSIEEIARRRRELTQLVRQDEFTSGDLERGTFTVSNLGPMGVESFDPIINPPQVAILAVNTFRQRPQPDGERGVQFTEVLPLGLSFDHRAVDGADAARFLETIAGHVEDPWPLLPDTVEYSADYASQNSVNRRRGTTTHGESLPSRHATAHSASGTGGTVETGSLSCDYGREALPEPVDLFLASVASCLSSSIRHQAKMRELEVDRVRVESDAHPQSGSVESVDVSVRIAAPDISDDTLARVIENGERACHVAELLRDDLPVELEWKRIRDSDHDGAHTAK